MPPCPGADRHFSKLKKSNANRLKHFRKFAGIVVACRQNVTTMLVYIHGAKCVGIEAVPIVIEVEIGLGIGIHLVGLADAAVKESLLRTVTALQAKGFHIPGKKIVINLAPADMHQQGSGYDVPIALGIIAASDQRNLPGLEKYLIMGELGLDGSIRPVSGVLPMVELARRCGFKGCIFPEESALEAVDYDDTLLFGVRTLEDVLCILEEKEDVSELLIWNTARYRRNGIGRRSRRPPSGGSGTIWILPISSARKGPSEGWKLPLPATTMQFSLVLQVPGRARWPRRWRGFCRP